MAMGSTLTVLMVGLGSIGQRHVRNLRHLLGDDVDIRVLRSRRLSHVITEQGTLDTQTGVEKRTTL